MTDDKLKQARAIVKQFYPEMPADYSGRRVQIVLAAFDRATDTQVSKHSELAGLLNALAGDCDEGENNSWENHEWAEAAKLLRDAATALRQAPAQVSRLVSALRTAEETFYRYASLHNAKATPEGQAKADANHALGLQMTAALDGIVSKSGA